MKKADGTVRGMNIEVGEEGKDSVAVKNQTRRKVVKTILGGSTALAAY